MASQNQINISFSEAESAEIDRISSVTGVARVELARRCVQALINYCSDGRRPTFPLIISSPGYHVEDGKVRDATIVMTGTEFGMDAPKKITYPTVKKKTPHKSTQSGAA